jgi:hypothetical protein
MAYRNDFYTLRNIIGYTGDLRYLPTVYFQRGHEYGHITQHHMLPYNVGREHVAYHPQYRIANHYRGGRIRAVEIEGMDIVHPSRNPFISRDGFGPGDLLTLSAAIFRFQELKLCYADPRNRDRVHAKHAMQHELLKQFRLVRDHRLDLFMPGADRNPAATRLIDNVVRPRAR